MKTYEILERKNRREEFLLGNSVPLVEKPNKEILYVGGSTFQILSNGQIVVHDEGLVEQII